MKCHIVCASGEKSRLRVALRDLKASKGVSAGKVAQTIAWAMFRVDLLERTQRLETQRRCTLQAKLHAGSACEAGAALARARPAPL
jgi:hypothetical protein